MWLCQPPNSLNPVEGVQSFLSTFALKQNILQPNHWACSVLSIGYLGNVPSLSVKLPKGQFRSHLEFPIYIATAMAEVWMSQSKSGTKRWVCSVDSVSKFTSHGHVFIKCKEEGVSWDKFMLWTLVLNSLSSWTSKLVFLPLQRKNSPDYLNIVSLPFKCLCRNAIKQGQATIISS